MTSIALLCLAGALGTQAELLVYEPFDYPDGWLTGQGGALGTTGTWTSLDAGLGDGWRVHPEGEPSGVFVAPGQPNVFDGTVDNLPTLGGFAGMAGPEDRGLDPGTDAGTGNLDASIGLDPAVTAKFTSGTTTWFSFVSVHAWDRNQGAPQFMISTETTTTASRGLSMVNAGNGIGAGGGPPRGNLQDIYPQFFRDGVNNHTPGGYQNDSGTNGGGTFGLHDGAQSAFGSGNDGTASGTLDENGQARTQTMSWVRDNPDGSFGAANIIIGKIEWDADTGGEDVISAVRFLETDTLDEAAFDAAIEALPALSSRNWASNKPNLDQSQFDLINFSSLKFFVDEIRLATTFEDLLTDQTVPAVPFELTITPATSPDTGYDLEWVSQADMLYNLRSSADLSTDTSTWTLVEGDIEASGTGSNTWNVNPSGTALFYRVEEFPPPPPPAPPLQNAGFENPVTADGAFTDVAPPNWSEFDAGGNGDVGVWNPPAGAHATVPEGENVGYVYHSGSIPMAAYGLSQTLGATFTADTAYTVTVEVGRSNTYAWPGYRVELWAGTTLLAEDNNTLTPTADSWASSTVSYTYDAGDVALVGEPLEIRFLSLGEDPNGAGAAAEFEVEFDNVTFTAVP